jgi:hypothetical protein
MKQEEGGDSAADEMSQNKAHELGQSLAQQIVAETTGLGVKPPPVRFP